LARTETHIAGKNVHPFVLKEFRSIGPVLMLFQPETTLSRGYLRGDLNIRIGT
jgi:hypothetical protein